MKSGILFVSVAFTAMLNYAPSQAQVLGGNVAGALGGTISGSTRGTGVLTQGDIGGSFGGGLETRTLHRATRDVAGRTRDRVRDTGAAARQRTESAVERVRDSSVNAAASATHSLSTDQAANATNVAGSAGALATANSSHVIGNAAAASNQATSMNVSEVADAATPAESAERPRSPAVSGVLTGNTDSASSLSLSREDAGARTIAGETSGSSSTDASASRNGVSAQTSAQASGATRVESKR